MKSENHPKDRVAMELELYTPGVPQGSVVGPVFFIYKSK
jgi:hypothetical protein